MNNKRFKPRPINHTSGSDGHDLAYLKQQALITLIASNPSSRQIKELCEQWRVEPVFFGAWQNGVLNRLATLAELAKYLESLQV